MNKLFAKKFDILFLVPMIMICFFGIVTMSSFGAADSYFLRQSIWITLGFATFFVLSRLDYDFLKKTSIILYFYLVTNLFLLATLIAGNVVKGSRAWIDFGAFSIQPADFAKISLIILLAKYFSKRHTEIHHLQHIVVSFVYAVIPASLILLQPDLGSAMVVMAIWFFMVLVSGISKKHLAFLFAAAVVVITLSWLFVFKDYQKARIMNFLDPLRDVRGSGYNVYQSQIAIGSGKFLGKGVGYGTQSRLNYLPEHETDFIFSAFAEEWGFVGVSLLLACFGIILFRLLYISYFSKSNFETLFAVGTFAVFFVHIVVNIGFNIGVLPVTGIPLPFMSYGGSHILTEFILIAVVSSFSLATNFARRKYKNEFLGLE